MKIIKQLFRAFVEMVEISNFERRAVNALLFFVLSLSVYHWAKWNLLIPGKDYSIISEAYEEIAKTAVVKSEPLVNMDYFDPNSADLEELIAAGLSGEVARNLVNYRNAFGNFSSVNELQKLYTIDMKLFEEIKPYVRINPEAIVRGRHFNGKIESEDTSQRKTYKKWTYTEKQSIEVEINSATVEQLMELRGIGPAFSSRIVAYRELLGGFYKIDQLLEVYGLTDSTFQLIKDHISIDTVLIRKLDINSADLGQLSRHPYISYKTAKLLLNFRKAHGGFTTLEFKGMRELDHKEISKIRPYLTLKKQSL